MPSLTRSLKQELSEKKCKAVELRDSHIQSNCSLVTTLTRNETKIPKAISNGKGDKCFDYSAIHSSHEYEIPNTLEAEFLHLVIGFWQWPAFPNLLLLQ
ncbi:hypothetical protein Patl1_06804 [Pistacia atlantica]|uniref:Uncharacterized protein n=1 Tax=Pistacia atlantica TaxID=434234 RepID=A0ACC1BR91_9ROSI|nr:hypothetical protein Patl1_06804 [Pistacia atlantica]